MSYLENGESKRHTHEATQNFTIKQNSKKFERKIMDFVGSIGGNEFKLRDQKIDFLERHREEALFTKPRTFERTVTYHFKTKLFEN